MVKYYERIAFYHTRGEKGTKSIPMDCSVQEFKDGCKVNDSVLDAIVTVIHTLKGTFYKTSIYNRRAGYTKQDYIDNL